MARGSVVGESIQSQAATEEYRESHERVFGDRPKNVRGRWIWDEQAGKLVRAEDYVPPAMAVNAPIISDRIHEGTTFDEGGRVVDIGSRTKRREFMRRTGLEDAGDASRAWLEGQRRDRERSLDRATDRAFDEAARKLHNERKLR